MKRFPATLGFALLACATSAHAEVKQAAADGFLIAFSEPTTATPAKAYAAVTAIPAWWDSEHTWSGKASNLSLKAEAGGWFCERVRVHHLENGGEHDATRPKTLLELEHLLLQFAGAFASLDCHDERRVDAGRTQRLDQERGWIELEH